jgi:GTP cyclohydrolase II
MPTRGSASRSIRATSPWRRGCSLLGQRKIRLLTNNPEKVAAARVAGITVVERVPHKLPANPHNERYLATKRDRTGHQL